MRRDPRDTVELPSQSIVEDELLCALNLYSRPVDPPAMYALLAERCKMTTLQLSALLPETKENAWKNRVRQARRRLVDLGYLDGSQRGAWLLTEAGRARACERERQKTFTPDDLGL
jgi:hypothetical protein